MAGRFRRVLLFQKGQVSSPVGGILDQFPLQSQEESFQGPSKTRTSRAVSGGPRSDGNAARASASQCRTLFCLALTKELCFQKIRPDGEAPEVPSAALTVTNNADLNDSREINFEYLKHVVLKFMSCRESEVVPWPRRF